MHRAFSCVMMLNVNSWILFSVRWRFRIEFVCRWAFKFMLYRFSFRCKCCLRESDFESSFCTSIIGFTRGFSFRVCSWGSLSGDNCYESAIQKLEPRRPFNQLIDEKKIYIYIYLEWCPNSLLIVSSEKKRTLRYTYESSQNQR